MNLCVQEMEVIHLSGTDKDHAVNWEFFCTEGANSGKWTTIAVPSCWETQGFGNYNHVFGKTGLKAYNLAFGRKIIITQTLVNHGNTLNLMGVMPNCTGSGLKTPNHRSRSMQSTMDCSCRCSILKSPKARTTIARVRHFRREI